MKLNALEAVLGKWRTMEWNVNTANLKPSPMNKHGQSKGKRAEMKNYGGKYMAPNHPTNKCTDAHQLLTQESSREA